MLINNIEYLIILYNLILFYKRGSFFGGILGRLMGESLRGVEEEVFEG